MMANLTQIKNGAKRYIEAEVLGQISDWRKWVIGAFAIPYLDQLDAVITAPATKQLMERINVMSGEDDRVDVDKLRDMFIAQSKDHGRVSINVPLVGPYFIGEQDVYKIYEYIITS